jgi:hypothetical protein
VFFTNWKRRGKMGQNKAKNLTYLDLHLLQFVIPQRKKLPFCKSLQLFYIWLAELSGLMIAATLKLKKKKAKVSEREQRESGRSCC